jgi:hypothetical protein
MSGVALPLGRVSVSSRTHLSTRRRLMSRWRELSAAVQPWRKRSCTRAKKLLKPRQPVSAIEVRPLCSILPHFGRTNRPLTLTAQVLLNPVTQVPDQMETIGDLSGLRRAYSGAFSVEPWRSRQTISTPGCWLSHLASDAEERSGSTSATVLASRSTRMVPHALPLRQCRVAAWTEKCVRRRTVLPFEREIPDRRFSI